MRWKRYAALAGALALAAAACNSPADRGPGTSPEPSTSQKAEIGATWANPPVPAEEVKGAQKGGTVTVVTSSTPDTFDPTRVYFTDSLQIMSLVTRSLTALKNVNGKSVLVPDMATDLGRPNKDFTQWEWTLRDGLKYEDGSPVKAADVAYAMKRQLAVAELPDGPPYSKGFFAGGDKYDGPYKSGDNFPAVSTPDDKTIRVKLALSFSDMSYYASFPSFTGIPKVKDNKTDYGNHPMATGPYKFKKYTPGVSLELERNKYWDPKTDPVRHQYPDGFVFKFNQDPTVFNKALIADNGPDETAITYSNLSPEDYTLAKQDAPDRIVQGPDSCIGYVYLDLRKIKDIKVRKAIGLAYPYDQINTASGVIPGVTWDPSWGILTPVLKGVQKYDVFGTGGTGPGKPEAAKKLLQEADAVGFQLTYYYNSENPLTVDGSLALKKGLTDAGFKVNAIPVTSAQTRTINSDPNSKANMRTGGGWCLDWNAASSVFPAQWLPAQSLNEGGPNPSYPMLPEFQWLQDEINRIMKLPANQAPAAWGALDKKLMEEYIPIIPTGTGGNAIVHGSKIGNVVWSQFAGMPTFSEMYVKK
ncbi:periplasmic substrate-binding domain-containing protein [Flindersiella endophytica]